MKKLIISAVCAMCGMAAMAQSYQVYKLQFNAKTTASKGLVVNGCCGDSDEYAYRDKTSVKIQGILAGCGCGAIKADGVCDVAFLYLWDATRKIAITNLEVRVPWAVQRIGKKANVIENFSAFKVTYGPEDIYGFELMLAGFGSYKDNASDADASYVGSISGNFAGSAFAPIYVKPGSCSACSITAPQPYLTTAFDVCENCSIGLTESQTSEYTPFFGTYSVSYDSAKSKACTKNGLSQKNLGLPSYVGIGDYAATNIIE